MDNAIITVPRGKGNGDLDLDLTLAFRAEARIMEIQAVTPHKAPELLAYFTDAFRDLSQLIQRVELEYNYAVRNADGIKSVVILDKAPQILQSKGLTTKAAPGGSADLRQAVLDADVEYQTACERVDQLKAVTQLLKDKRHAIEMGFTSVKKLLGEQAYNYGGPSLSHGTTPDNVEAGMTISHPSFGSSRYK